MTFIFTWFSIHSSFLIYYVILNSLRHYWFITSFLIYYVISDLLSHFRFIAWFLIIHDFKVDSWGPEFARWKLGSYAVGGNIKGCYESHWNFYCRKSIFHSLVIYSVNKANLRINFQLQWLVQITEWFIFTISAKITEFLEFRYLHFFRVRNK